MFDFNHSDRLGEAEKICFEIKREKSNYDHHLNSEDFVDFNNFRH